MKQEQFIEYLNQPSKLNAKTIAELQTMSAQYPYCASVASLLTLNFFREKNIQFESQLGKNAAIAPDRKILKAHVDQLCDMLENIEFPDEFIEKAKAEESKEVKVDEAAKVEDKIPEEVKTEKQKPKAEVSESKTKAPEAKVKQSKPEETEKPKDDFIKKAKETQAEVLDKELDEKVRRDSEKIKELKARIEKKLAEIERAKKGTKESPQDTSKTEPTSKIEDLKTENKSKSKDELIEQFIYTSPSISRHQSSFYNPLESAQQSIVDQENIVSETLAKIYNDQGYKEKAIKIYRKLSLKFPEKSTYFAAQIEKIEKELQ